MRRCKGSGTIYKKNGKFYVRLRRADNHGGHIDVTSAAGKTIFSAERKIKELQQKHCINADSSQRLSEFIGVWLDRCFSDRSSSTKMSYTSQVKKHILPALGHLKLSEIRPSHLTAFYSDLQQSLKPRSIRRINAILCSIFNQAIRFEILAFNPTRAATKPRINKRRLSYRILNAEEYVAFIAMARESEYKFPILFQLMLGMRRGEALGMTWESINLSRKLLSINKQLLETCDGITLADLKTESSLRSLPIPSGLYAELVKVVPSKRKGLVVGPKKLRKPRRYVRCVREIADRLGIQNFRPHDLRHTVISHLSQYGVDLPSLAKFAGHASVDTTGDIYAHQVPGSSQNKIIAAIDATCNSTGKDNVAGPSGGQSE